MPASRQHPEMYFGIEADGFMTVGEQNNFGGGQKKFVRMFKTVFLKFFQMSPKKSLHRLLRSISKTVQAYHGRFVHHCGLGKFFFRFARIVSNLPGFVSDLPE